MNLKKLIEYPKEGILSKSLHKKENISLFCMAAGAEMDEHTSTKKVIVYVVEGKGIFKIGKEGIIMKPGEIITLDKNEKHSLRAKEKTSFLLIVY